jgi:hypothetical protein
LTPEPKDQHQLDTNWLQQKFTNFKTVVETKPEDVEKQDHKIFSPIYKDQGFTSFDRLDYEILAEMTREIKIADEAANIRETVDDIRDRNDGHAVVSNGIKSLKLRFEDFTARYSLINLNFKNCHRLQNQLGKDLDFIRQYLRDMAH